MHLYHQFLYTMNLCWISLTLIPHNYIIFAISAQLKIKFIRNIFNKATPHSDNFKLSSGNSPNKNYINLPP